jgi:hypothetical protein
VASPDGRSRPSSMNSSPRKYPRSTTYSSPRSRSRRAEYGTFIPVLPEMLTTRTLRPSKSTFPPRWATPIASSYLIPVGLSSSVMRGSLPAGGRFQKRLGHRIGAMRCYEWESELRRNLVMRSWDARNRNVPVPFRLRELRLDGVLRSSSRGRLIAGVSAEQSLTSPQRTPAPLNSASVGRAHVRACRDRIMSRRICTAASSASEVGAAPSSRARRSVVCRRSPRRPRVRSSNVLRTSAAKAAGLTPRVSAGALLRTSWSERRYVNLLVAPGLRRRFAQGARPWGAGFDSLPRELTDGFSRGGVCPEQAAGSEGLRWRSSGILRGQPATRPCRSGTRGRRSPDTCFSLRPAEPRFASSSPRSVGTKASRRPLPDPRLGQRLAHRSGAILAVRSGRSQLWSSWAQMLS